MHQTVHENKNRASSPLEKVEDPATDGGLGGCISGCWILDARRSSLVSRLLQLNLCLYIAICQLRTGLLPTGYCLLTTNGHGIPCPYGQRPTANCPLPIVLNQQRIGFFRIYAQIFDRFFDSSCFDLSSLFQAM